MGRAFSGKLGQTWPDGGQIGRFGRLDRVADLAGSRGQFPKWQVRLQGTVQELCTPTSNARGRSKFGTSGPANSERRCPQRVRGQFQIRKTESGKFECFTPEPSANSEPEPAGQF
jgi:hypothetical protein